MEQLPDRPESTPFGADVRLRLSTWLVVLLLATGFYSYLNRAYAAISSDVQLDYGEGTVFWQAHNLLHPARAVHHLGVYPFILFNYTPVYHYATVLMAQAMPGLLSAGRLVSVLAMLGVCLLAGIIVRRATHGWASYPCAAMAALFLLYLPNADWSLLMRVDTIGLFFTYLGLSCFLLAARRPWLTYAAFTCFTLALYSKQTLIAAPAACLIILFTENRHRAWRALAVIASEGLAILGVAAVITHGELVRHLFTYNVSPLNWKHGLWLAWDQGLRSGVFLVMALAYLTGMLRGKRGSQSRTAVVFGVYFAVSAVASLSILKAGANVNYLLEPLLAACVLAALFVADRLTIPADKRVWGMALRYATLAAVGIMAVAHLYREAGVPTMRETLQQREPAQKEIVKWLESLPGDVYSEDMTILLQAGKEVPGEPSSVTFLASVGLWNERALVRRFQSRMFSAVVVDTSLYNQEHFSPAVRAAVNAQYERKEDIGIYGVYLPRTTSPITNSIAVQESHESTVNSVPQS